MARRVLERRAAGAAADRLRFLAGDTAQARAGAVALRNLGGLIGLFWTAPAATDEAWPAEVLEMVARREAARKAKNWKESDEMRDALKARGLVVEDSAQGPRLKRID
jgi:cysteinyl-tRNA synthetase